MTLFFRGQPRIWQHPSKSELLTTGAFIQVYGASFWKKAARNRGTFMPLAEPPRTIADVIDDIERIREELLHLQRELEEIESRESRENRTTSDQESQREPSKRL
jgi:hypothetical protein